jgi:hypothetical protein
VVKLLVAEREPGEPGQVSDLVAGYRHGPILGRTGWQLVSD